MEKNLSGLKYILAGVSVMILSSLALDISQLFLKNSIVNWADCLVHGLGWLMVFLGISKCRKNRKEFKIAQLAAVAGLVSAVGQVLFAFKEYRAGLADIAFIDIKVMFFEYVGLLAMLYVLYMTMVGTAQLLAKNGLTKRAAKAKKTAYTCVLITLGTCMLTPFAYVFPTAIKIIVAGASIALGAAAQFYMANYINTGYKKLI